MRKSYSAAPARSARLGNAVALKDTPGVEAPVMPDNVQQTDIYTYFTKAGETRLLTSAKRWTLVRLTLENAGPVAIGTKQTITPVLSGKGRLLPTGEEIQFTLAPGNRLFIAAEAVNRVSVTIEPIAYLDQIYQHQIMSTNQLQQLITALMARGGLK
jgi:hypothetical protein